MNECLSVLLIDDEPAQAFLVGEYLRTAAPGQVNLTTAESLAEGLDRLAARPAEVVLLDLCLPDSLGSETFTRLHEAWPQLPVVVMTSLEDEQLGQSLVQLGAQDFLVKGQIGGPMLLRALRYAIERRRAQAERDDLIAQLQAALEEVRTLSGMLPMCAWCHKIRDDAGYWKQVEVFIAEHTSARFSHGICPDCMRHVCPGDAISEAWLTPLDVLDPIALVARFRDASDPLTVYLRAQFASTTVAAMGRQVPGKPVERTLVESIVAEINRLFERESLYTAERFARVDLPDTVCRLLDEPSHDLGSRILLNRGLLQAAYPDLVAPLVIT